MGLLYVIKTMGRNSSTQVGDGTGTYRYSPVQIGSATNWSNVSAGYYHSIGVRSDGTLWGWGKNTNGQVGNGTTSAYVASPTQIGSSYSWGHISAGREHTFARTSI